MLNAAAMPLTMAAPGRLVRLVQVNGEEQCCRRLAELGLTPGVELTVMQDEGGPLLLCVRESRIALARGLAHKVQVVECDDCPHTDGGRKPFWLRGRSCCDPQNGGTL
jgi:ferrous iron transport protein A